MTPLLTGLHVPLVTPFDAAGRVDADALARLADRVLDDGAAGLVALGTTAEAETLTAAEQELVVTTLAGVCAARRGAGVRGAGVRGAGERGAGERGAVAHGAGERGAGERGAGERGAGERGAGERGAGERGAGERGAGAHGADAIARAAGASAGAPLTVAVGGVDTAAVARAVERRSAQAGVTAILSVVPPYVRPATAGIVAHFEALAAVSAVPLLAYEIPYRTGVRLGADALLALARGGRLAGVKLSLSALDLDALELLAHAPPDFAVLAGEDALIFSMAAAGAAGAIAASGHCCTRRLVALLATAASGDLVAARAHARALLPLQRALFAEPSPSVLKGVLHRRGLIATPTVRLPHVAASEAAVDAACAAVEAAAVPHAAPAAARRPLAPR